MKTKILSIATFLLISSTSFCQTIEDFEASSTSTISSWGYTSEALAIANPQKTGNTSATVLQVTKDGPTFGTDPVTYGVKIAFAAPLAVPAGATEISFQIWTALSATNTYFQIASVGGLGTETNIYKDWVGTLVPNTWNTINVAIPAGTTSIDMFYLNPGCWDSDNECPAGNGVYYFDNFKFVVPVKSNYAMDFESTANLTISSWGVVAAPTVVANPKTQVNTSAKVLKITKEVDTYAQGVKIVFKTPMVIPTGAKKLSFQIYTEVAASNFYFKYGDYISPTADNIVFENWVGPLTAGSWQTVTVDLVLPIGTTIGVMYFHPGCWDGVPANACPAANGVYYVDNFMFDVLANVDEATTMSNTLSCFPNPVVDRLYFSSSVASVEVYSIAGSKVLSAEMNANVLNVSELESGLYLVKTFSKDNSVQVSKIIKQ